MAFIVQKIDPILPFIFIPRCETIDKVLNIFKGMGICLVNPKMGLPKEGIVHEMILVGMGIDKDLHGLFLFNGQKGLFITGSVDNGTSFIINKQAVTVGVFPASDEFDPTLFEIVHGLAETSFLVLVDSTSFSSFQRPPGRLSENEIVFPRSRKGKIITTGIR